jgi:hypothetical protein
VFAEPSRYFASVSHKEDDAQCFEQCEWYCKTGQVKNPKLFINLRVQSSALASLLAFFKFFFLRKEFLFILLALEIFSSNLLKHSLQS